jgi:photosystem II stability/assembly factor-like uncharacterized protein
LTVTVPPRSPEIEHDRDLAQRVTDLEALIEEARRRARRRRRIYAALVLAAVAAAAWVSFDIGGSGGASLGRSVAAVPSGVSAAHAGAAGWQPLGGPGGGAIFAIAIDPADSKVVYAGGLGKVFKSTNGGGSWKRVSDEPWTEVGALAIDPAQPRVVYAGTDRGIAKTKDGGRHWRMANTGLFERVPLPPPTASLAESFVWSLTIDAQHPATVYATTARGLYRTTNGGKRWQIIGPAFLRHQIAVPRAGSDMRFAIDPNHARTIYASWSRGGVPSKLYKSGDGGSSWRRITASDPLPLWFEELALTASGALLATAGGPPPGAYLYRSSDGGTTWSHSGPPGEMIGGLIVDRGSGTIYVTTTSGAVFQTSDGGHSWHTAPADLAGRYEIVTDPSDPATIYATADAGRLLKSVDHGHTWKAADAGIVSTVISTLALVPGSPATLYAAASGTEFPLAKSTDRGRTWHSASAGLGEASVVTLAVDPQRPRAIFAGTRGSGLFESADGGLHWSRVQIGIPKSVAVTVLAIAADPQRPNTVYIAACRGADCGVGGPGSFLKTVDGGVTWQKITSMPGWVQSLAIDPHAGSTIFAGTARGTVFRSKDAGRSWRQVATAPGVSLAKPDPFIAIAIDPLNPDNIYASSRTHGILKSTDGGTTWAAANAGLTDLRISALAVDPRNPQVLFSSTEGGVFRSSNGAHSWLPYNRGLPAGGVAAFAINPAGHTLFAGTNGDGVVPLSLGG